MKKHICSLSRLFIAFLCGLFGVLLFKNIYKDFSPFDPSYQMIFEFLGSTLLITLGTYVGFTAFRE